MQRRSDHLKSLSAEVCQLLLNRIKDTLNHENTQNRVRDDEVIKSLASSVEVLCNSDFEGLDTK